MHQPRHGSDELVNIPRDTSDLGQQMLRMVYNATRRHDVSIDPLTPWGQSQYHSIRLVQERDAGFTPSYDEAYFQLEPPDKRYVELHAECCPSLAE